MRLARSAAALQGGQRLRVGRAGRRRAAAWNLLGDVVDDAVVPVLAAQAHVALDGERLEALLRQAHQRHVERAAAEVVDEDGLLLVGSGVGRRPAAAAAAAGSE